MTEDSLYQKRYIKRTHPQFCRWVLCYQYFLMKVVIPHLSSVIRPLSTVIASEAKQSLAVALLLLHVYPQEIPRPALPQG